MTSEAHPERLLIALEPEAASVYVRKLRLYQLVHDTAVTQTLGRGGSASARTHRYSYHVADTTPPGTLPLPVVNSVEFKGFGGPDPRAPPFWGT